MDECDGAASAGAARTHCLAPWSPNPTGDDALRSVPADQTGNKQGRYPGYCNCINYFPKSKYSSRAAHSDKKKMPGQVRSGQVTRAGLFTGGSRLAFGWGGGGGGQLMQEPNLEYPKSCFLIGCRPLIFHHSPDTVNIFF